MFGDFKNSAKLRVNFLEKLKKINIEIYYKIREHVEQINEKALIINQLFMEELGKYKIETAQATTIK